MTGVIVCMCRNREGALFFVKREQTVFVYCVLKREQKIVCVCVCVLRSAQLVSAHLL